MPTPAAEIARFTRRVGSALRGPCRAIAESRLVLAVSGGADSVALLRVMAKLRTQRGWRLQLAVAHVQHHLRPEAEAEADAAFVAALAASLELPLLRADLTREQIIEAGRGNIESGARRLRYHALAELAGIWHADAVLTAHQADDQLETILLRLLRGASAGGLAGMRWRRRLVQGSPLMLLRPMLATTRAEAVRFLHALSQPWCEDATNTDRSRARARLRADVLPVLRDLAPHAATRAMDVSAHLGELDQLLADAIDTAATQARRIDADGTPTWTLARDMARPWRQVVLAGLLRRLALDLGARKDQISRVTLRTLCRAIHDQQGGTRRFTLGGINVTLTRDTITWQPPRSA